MTPVSLGFDIGGTSIKAAVVSQNSKHVASTPFSFGASATELAATLYEFGMCELARQGYCIDDVQKVGVATAGSLDSGCRVIIDAHNLGLHHVKIADELERIFVGKTVRVLNDADAAAIGELNFGALKNTQDSCLITLGTGIGAGIIIGGTLYRGGNRRGTEVGHMTLNIRGEECCTCGNRGCFESNCSATFLENKGKKAFSDANMTAKKVIDMAKDGNSIALSIFEDYVDRLSYGIASIMNVLDPEIIALAGGVSLAGDFLLEPLKEQVKDKCFFEYPGKLVIAELQADAGAIGAATI